MDTWFGPVGIVFFERVTAEVFKKDGRTIFTAKAFNGRVLTEWLARCLTNAAQHPDMYHDPENQIDLLASCAYLGGSAM